MQALRSNIATARATTRSEVSNGTRLLQNVDGRSSSARRFRDLVRAYEGELSYLILAKHSVRRSSSERTCPSMVFCNASVPLLDNSAEAFLSRFCFQSRIACLVALWASDVALRYAFMHSGPNAALYALS